MKKIRKTKAGFTFLEMILVVAIIVILAGVIMLSVGTYIQNAKDKSNEAEQVRQSAYVNIMSSEARMSALGFGNTGSNIRVVEADSAVLVAPAGASESSGS